MDGSTLTERIVPLWNDPRDRTHPHQLWLAAERHNRVAIVAAFQAACPTLTVEQCEAVFRLHDSAQYEFIKLLLWHDGSGRALKTVAEALAAAEAEHQRVTTHER